MTLFGSSGIRRIFDQDLFDIVGQIAQVVGTKYRNIVVGRDTRTSSDTLMNLAMAGLTSVGAKVFSAGLVTTPTIAVLAHQFDAGLMITASHNPAEYNGIKLINPDGSSFSLDQQREIQDIFDNKIRRIVDWTGIQNSVAINRPIERHISHIRRKFPKQYKIKVAIDCACGAGSVITPILLRRMGCDVVELNTKPNGFFPHPVEPLPENLDTLGDLVIESRADVGIAHDGDADRMMAFDDKGRFISGDKLLRIFSDELNAQEVVTTVDASMIIDESKFKVHRTPVGDSFVSEKMRIVGDFGGEPSGAWIFRENCLCPDGVFAAAFLTSIAAEKKLSDLVDAIPEYPILRKSITKRYLNLDRLESALTKAFHPRSILRIDGIKLLRDDSWILIRPSGTEPKVRITVEARDQACLQSMFDHTLSLIQEPS